MSEPCDPSPIIWDAEGRPRSRRYGDVYFSDADGLAESRAVFLGGCGLPQAWEGRRRFTVAELGFGTGLNIAALLDLWGRRDPAHGGHLSIFSVEAHPLSRDEAARALAGWPDIAGSAQALLDHWPGRARGLHRIDLPGLNATLDLAVMDAGEALAAWSGRADAWFLDGFSPALNPQMWTAELMRSVAARSAPAARLATFTVAGQVRQDLAAAGFAVVRAPGFGRKRERLEARAPGAAADPPSPTVAVIGAGIAGAAAARAIRALGGACQVIEAAHPGAGASGFPAALVTPRLDAGLGPPAALAARAFARAVALYEDTPGAVIARGVVQLAAAPRDEGRFAKVAASDLFEPGELAWLSAGEAGARLGETGEMGSGGLDLARALSVDPAAILAAWTGPVTPGAAASLEPEGDGWIVRDAEGAVLLRAGAMIVAAGGGTAGLLSRLPLSPLRGQASFAPGAGPVPAAAWGGYVLPMAGGLMFGATHDRGDTGTDLRPQDHQRNLTTLAKAFPALAARLSDRDLEGRAAIRWTTPDRTPLAGAAGAPGLHVLGGFGARGYSFAPLLAEHLAALILGAPSPLAAEQAALVDPGRYLR